MRKLKSYKIWTESINFNDKEWTNLEKEFEEIVDKLFIAYLEGASVLCPFLEL